MFVSDRRLYLNSDKSRIVEEDSPEATFLLVGKGGALDDSTAQQYGLIGLPQPLLASSAPDGPPSGADVTSTEAETKALELPHDQAETLPEHKAVEPSENKQIFPAANNRTRRKLRNQVR